ncbi:hypothetical protein ACHAXR_011377 [Thalassiosira sp. AJA248-18]
MSSSDSSGTTEPPSGSSTDLLDTIRKVGTTLYGGMKQSGCMFDIRVPTIAEGGPPEGVTIMALEVSTFLTTETCFEVYTKTGTYEGYEGDIVQNANGSWGSPTWSILGASTVVGQGEELPTHLPIGSLDPVHVLPGQRQAFYVTMTTPEMRYTAPMHGEASGTLFNRSPLGHLEILVGSAVAYPFDEVWSDRIFNGAVVYALGDVPDGRYNDMTAGERKRTCYVPPSDSSVVEEEDETTTYTTSSPTYRPTASPSPPVSTTDVSTVDPSSIDSVDDPPASSSNDQQDDFAAPPRLSGTCPSAYLHDSSTKEVNVPYEYTMVTESSSLAKWMKLIMVATEMENAIHRSLMEDKCGGAFGKRRGLQGSSGGANKVIVYKGFNSKPEDKVTNYGCDDVILGAGQLCNLVQGGVTAMVQSSANEMAVRSDLESYIGRLISDPATFEGMGVAQVAFAGDKIDTGLPVPGGDQDPEGIYTQDGSTTPEDQNNKNSELIKTIIILAVCVSFFIVLSMELKVRRERRNARAKAAQEAQEEGKGEKSPGGYEEGDDSDSDPGDTYGDTALASMSMTSSSYRRERRRTRGGDSLGSDGDDGSMTLTTGAGMSKEPDIILQDLEDMSQFSNADQSRSSSLMALDSTKDGLRGSSGGAGSSLDGSTGSSEASYEYIKKSGNGSTMTTTASWLLLLACSLFQTAFAQVHTLDTTYAGGWIQDGVMFDVQTATANSNSTGTPDGITIHGLNILTPSTTPICIELYTKVGSFSTASSNPSAWTFLGSFSIVGQGSATPTSIPLGAFDPIVLGVGEVQGFYVTTQNEKMRYTALSDSETGDVFVESVVHTAGNGVNSVAAIERTSGVAEDEEAEEEPEEEIKEEEEEDEIDGHVKIKGNKAKPPRGKQERTDPKGKQQDDRTLQTTEDGLTVQILTGVAKNYPFLESWTNRVFNGAILYTIGQDSTISLTDDQRDEVWNATRGAVTCDVDAMNPESYPSLAPSEVRYPTSTPTNVPTTSPSKGPSVAPTVAPSTLEDTIRKVATTLHGGLKQSGCMFDIRVPSVEEGGPAEGLTVLALELSTFLTNTTCVEVYTKTGTYEGFENDVTQADDGSWGSEDWSILGAATVMGAGEKNPTHIPIGSIDPVYVPPGSTQAFYVTLTHPEMRYTQPKFNEVSGTLFSGSPLGHIELMVGSAVAYPFGEVWKDRIFNGAVVYALGDVEDGTYNDMGVGDRNRTCPLVTESPTSSPTMVPSTSPTKVPTASPTTASPVAVAEIAENTTATTVATTASIVVNTTTTTTTAATTASSTAVTSPGDVVDVVEETTTKNPTTSPTFGLTSTVDDGNTTLEARHADVCPGAVVTATSTTKDVIVPYEYTVITDGSSDINMVITDMEHVLHSDLMEDVCSGGAAAAGARRRSLQEEVAYQGFNSNPPDTVLDQGCSSSVTLVANQECYLIQGGVTAVVDGNADETVVKDDIGSFVEGVYSDKENYDGMGVQVAYIAPTTTDAVPDTNSTTTDGEGGTIDGGDDGDNSNLGIDGATGGNQDPGDPTTTEPTNKSLSTTGIIILAVFGATLVLVVLGLFAMRMIKKRRTQKQAKGELFHEFPDEMNMMEDNYSYTDAGRAGTPANTYGISASNSRGYHESFAPLGMAPPPPPPGRPLSRSSNRSNRSSSSRSAGKPAMILNEEDDISLFSNKSKFAPSALLGGLGGGGTNVPDSPGSRGSGGSNSSKKSVEFVKAGQSFSSRQTGNSQPEDTVDL